MIVDQLLDDANVRVLEFSVELTFITGGHILLAVNIDCPTDLTNPVHRDIASREVFRNLLKSAGIHKNTAIVIYGANSNSFAAWV